MLERAWFALMKITYFAHDLSDAAVARRVRMLQAGGAEVALLGFRRMADPVGTVEGVEALDLGQTFEGRLATRAGLVLRRSLQAARWAPLIEGADVLLARNMEMCAIAAATRARAGSRARLVYECLDIHGAVSGSGAASRLLRALERLILKHSAALVVSSPGFLTHHFDRLGVALPPVILAENKRVLLDQAVVRPPHDITAGPPWRIGWFGLLRCVKSFQMLLDLASRFPGLVDIDLRGLPTAEVQALIDANLPVPGMRFHGRYQQADLAALYADRHLTWAVDYTERGRNSDWLLPNRIYEGGFYGLPAIALAGTQTGQWLQDRGTGVVLAEPETELQPVLAGLDPARYAALTAQAAAVPDSDLVWTRGDCVRLAAEIAGTAA